VGGVRGKDESPDECLVGDSEGELKGLSVGGVLGK